MTQDSHTEHVGALVVEQKLHYKIIRNITEANC